MAVCIGSTGGYEHTFVEDVHEKYTCPICNEVLRDAQLTECCGQHFCDSCLRRWLEDNDSCPNCRQENLRHVLNKEKDREILELTVLCNNSEKGCDWVGKLKEVKKHLEGDDGCEYKIVCCSRNPNRSLPQTGKFIPTLTARARCDAKMERRYLVEHRKDRCKYRAYTCEHCGYEDTYESIAGAGKNHYRKCPNFPLECPNKCGESELKRKEVRSHRRSCPFEPMECSFNFVGCTELIKRKDMDEHRKNNMEKHLELLAKSHQKLQLKLGRIYGFHEEEEEYEEDEERESSIESTPRIFTN